MARGAVWLPNPMFLFNSFILGYFMYLINSLRLLKYVCKKLNIYLGVLKTQNSSFPNTQVFCHCRMPFCHLPLADKWFDIKRVLASLRFWHNYTCAKAITYP